MGKRKCTGTTKAGKPCGAPPRKGQTTCMGHAPKEEKESARFGGPQPGAGRPRNPRAVEVLRERIEANIDRWLQPVEDALEAERGLVVGDGDSARVEYVTDHPTRLKAFTIAMDRAYGRPMQMVDVTARVNESDVDRDIRELLGEMNRRDPKRSDVARANGRRNGKVSA